MQVYTKEKCQQELCVYARGICDLNIQRDSRVIEKKSVINLVKVSGQESNCADKKKARMV